MPSPGSPHHLPLFRASRCEWKKGAEPLHRAKRAGFISEMLTISTTLTFCGTHGLIARRSNVQPRRSGQVFNLQRRSKYVPELLV